MSELDTVKQAAKAIYTYTDEAGNTLFTKERYVKKDGNKGYAYSHVNSDGDTVKTMPVFDAGTKLYNLHRLAKYPNETVYLVEGEKCVDALTQLRLLATTSGGAQSAEKADWQILVGREVVIWPDHDQAGLQYAIDALAKLSALNVTVTQIDIDQLNLLVKGDCVDWLQQFKQVHGHDATKADIQALQLKTDAHSEPVGDCLQGAGVMPLPYNNHITVSLQCAADITPEPIRWLWNGWLAKGKLHIFAGMAGTGKTTIAIALAATITTGGRFPDGSKCPIGSVLIWSGEDSPADTLVPRLMAAGADLSKVHFVGETTADYELRGFDPATDMQPLMIKAASIPDLALLIIDPIVNAVAGDSHKNGEVRRALQPVVDFGEKLNCAVLGITHFSKGGQGKDPLERVTGSLAFGALARIVLATAKINDGDKTKRIVCRAKSNIGIDTGGFEYDLQEKEVDTGIFSSYALWGDAVDGSALELLAEPDNRETGSDNQSALDDAKAFLQLLLADGELPQKQIKDDANGASHSWRTVERAKKELNIRATKSLLDKCWYWKLSGNSANDDQHRQDRHINSVAVLADLPKIEHIPSENSTFEHNDQIARF